MSNAPLQALRATVARCIANGSPVVEAIPPPPAAVPGFAVIVHYAMLCPSTDAIMGEGKHVACRFTTKAAADAYADKENEAAEGDARFTVELRPYREGEDGPQRPLHSMPELIADRYAHDRDLGAPAWAL